MKGLITIMERYAKRKGDNGPLDSSSALNLWNTLTAAVLGVKSELHFPDAWQATAKAHPSSSRLARFDGDLTLPSAASPLAEIIDGARCEISRDSFSSPVSLTSAGGCIAVSTMGGLKDRTPSLSYYLPDASIDGDFPLSAHHLKVGLTEIAFSSTADTKRKLIFLADSSRVKSYAWANEQTGTVYKAVLPTHTLGTPQHHGPLAVLASEHFLRAGTGSAAVWNFSELKTHGTDGRARIGKHFNTRDTWRDEDDEIEDSSGSEPSSSLKFADSKLMPSRWHLHPSLPTTMLCASDPSITRDYL
jgi:hypothetical protein